MSTLITTTLQGINTIKYDSSTTAMTIDSNGRVSQPDAVKILFNATLTTDIAAGVITNNSLSQDTFTTSSPGGGLSVEVDTASAFNGSTGVYTIPVTGHYRISYGCTKASGASNVMHMDIYTNGTKGNSGGVQKRCRANEGSSPYSVAFVSYIDKLSANDALTLRAHGSGGMLATHNFDWTIEFLG